MKPNHVTSPRAGALLDENFASDVLKRADVLIARRRSMREWASGLAVAGVVAVVIVASLPQDLLSGTGPKVSSAGGITAALADDRTVGRQTEALMFPDAASSVEIDNAYFAADSSGEDILPAYASDRDTSE